MEPNMYDHLMKALAVGYERIVAWADILDRINVYPVADGDTGRNLVITLSALRNTFLDIDLLNREILLSARGNSGNIAARFLTGLLGCRGIESLPESAVVGRNLAYQAVSNPQPGTILSLYDTLVSSLKRTPPEKIGRWVDVVIGDLVETVRITVNQLPELRKARVVDAGALGMLVFLDPLLNVLAGRSVRYSFLMEDLKDHLILSPTWHEQEYQGYCLDVVLSVEREEQETMKQIRNVGESLVAMPERGCFKVHLHAADREGARRDLSTLGTILSWTEDDLAEQSFRFNKPKKNQGIHIMTDAAGSITRDLAQGLGMTLLSSYITVDNFCLLETYMDPSRVFNAMKGGAKVSTSQASVAERNECYNNGIKLYNRVLYLCVGSFYTGNYDVAMKWKTENDPEDRMTIIDTGVASGKLGLISRETAELSLTVSDPLEVISFARSAIPRAQEYIFLDKLGFLAAGGRMSKTGAFFGDVLHIKPIVSPYPDGARKIGVVRNTRDQIKFAFGRLEQDLPKHRETTLLLEFTDNRKWLEEEVKPEIEHRFPLGKVIMQSFSLTSAAHMGPGSWGIAFLTENPEQGNSNV